MTTENNFDFQSQFFHAPETSKPSKFSFVKEMFIHITNAPLKSWLMPTITLAGAIAIMQIPNMVEHSMQIKTTYDLKALQLNNSKELALKDKQISLVKARVQETAAKNEAEKLKNIHATTNIAQEIKLVKKLTPEDMTALTDFMLKIKTNENHRLDVLTSKIYYVALKDPSYKLGQALKDLAILRHNMNNHYVLRGTELNQVYKQISMGLTDFVPTTYDGQDILGSVLFWHNAQQLNTPPSFEEIDNYATQWEAEFTDQVGIDKYVKEHTK
jgi:hypothetical protein